MTRARGRAGVVILAAGLGITCGPKRIEDPNAPQALVVLLPDSDGHIGRVRITSGSRSAELNDERDSTIATAGRRPGPVTTMSEADVQRVFAEALAALPPPPRHFTLFFRFESDELTEDSRALVPEILRTVKDRSDPEVAVVGHTDTMGTPRANVELGLKRATMVRNLLVEAGLDAKSIDVTSHGEGDLLVKTPNDKAEPRNRRVEISVR